VFEGPVPVGINAFGRASPAIVAFLDDHPAGRVHDGHNDEFPVLKA